MVENTPNAKSEREENKEISEKSSENPLSPPKNNYIESSEILNKAEALAKRIEEGNKKAEEIFHKQEALAARMVLGGKAEYIAKPTSPDDKLNQDAEEIIKKFRKN